MKTLPYVLTIVALAVRLSAVPVRPNVLFIAVDDLRPQLGCYGDPAAITPNLDRLAARGTLFTRAYCQQAVCNASRQSMLSGRRPDSIRVWDLQTNFRQTAPDVVSLPEYFKRNGYRALALGKIYHDGMPDPESWSEPTQFEVMPKKNDYQLPENRGDHKAGKAAATEFAAAPEDDYPDGKVAAGAVAQLERLAADTSGTPFFLAVGIRKPHLPFTAPKKYWDLYENVKLPAISQPGPPEGAPEIALHTAVELRGYSDQPEIGPWSADQVTTLRRGYYAAASFADAQIGRVLAALERTGLNRNTIVIVWGDHGYHLGELGLWTKITNYEATTRVPLIVAVPGGQPEGVRSQALVELLDIYPTLVELCGLPPKDQLEGRSFAANLGHPEVAGRSVALSQFPRPWASGKPLAQPQYMGYAARDATHRYVEWRDLEHATVVAREFYAYQGDDMFEHTNLAADPASRAAMERLAAQLPRSPARKP